MSIFKKRESQHRPQPTVEGTAVPLLYGHSCVSGWTLDPREINLQAGLNQSDSPSLGFYTRKDDRRELSAVLAAGAVGPSRSRTRCIRRRRRKRIKENLRPLWGRVHSWLLTLQVSFSVGYTVLGPWSLVIYARAYWPCPAKDCLLTKPTSFGLV